MSTQESNRILRAASKNDRRYITRHALGFYGALIMTGLYTLDSPEGADTFDTADINTYIPALKWCVAAHPILNTGIRGEDSESPAFVGPVSLDLRRHVEVARDLSLFSGRAEDTDGGELERLKRVTLRTHDQTFQDVERVPPWKIVVLPISEGSGEEKGVEGESMSEKGGRNRVYIIFAYSHSHGDGGSGLAFHRTFLEGLRRARHMYDCNPIFAPPSVSELKPFPPALEDACTLRITWSFLFLTLWGAYVPEFVRGWLGFQTPLPRKRTWTGRVMSYNPGNCRTGSEILLVKKERMDGVLQVCRTKGGARFTGLLNQLVVRALSGALTVHDPSRAVENFIGTLVVNLRGLVPAYSDDMMVNCVSAMYEDSPRVSENSLKRDLKDDAGLWDAVRRTTTRLANSARTLVDHPIGLVQHLDKWRPWFIGKLGKARDTSYEISNVAVFDPSPKDPTSDLGPDDGGEKTWGIERMVFSQPANVTNCPLSFSVVTRRDGDMVMTMNWQVGVLGVSNEDRFARDVLSRIGSYLAELERGTS